MDNTSRTIYIILLILTVLVFSIYLYQSHNKQYQSQYQSQYQWQKERFDNLDSNTLVNLPIGDVHFITDNNPALISTPILNYKLSVLVSPDNNSRITKYISVFMHQIFQFKNASYSPLGQYMQISNSPLDIKDLNSNDMINVRSKKCINYLCSSSYYPLDYKLIWTSDTNTEGKIFSVWQPMAPSGTIALSDVIVEGVSKPPNEYITCIPINLLQFTKLSNGILWHSKNDISKECYCWGAGNFDTFRASNTYSGDMLELISVANINEKILSDNTLSNTVSNDKKVVNGILI